MSIEDKAQDHEILVWKQINASRGPVTYQIGEPGYGPEFCGCGEAIPMLRRQYGFRHCIDCASVAESRRRF